MLQINSSISDESKIIKWAAKFGWGKDIIIRWSLTQKSTITEQLTAGIRYFDMRVGYLADRKDFFFVHGCYGYAIVDLLKEMKVFLDNNPKEVLIVDFNHFYSFTDEIHKVFTSLILQQFNELLYPCDGKQASVDKLSLKNFWDSKKQVFARYCDDTVCAKHNLFWPSKYIDSPWFDTDSISKLLPDLNDRFDTLQDGVFNVFQAILTPQTSTILLHITSSLEKELAEPGNIKIKTWLGDVFERKQKGMNILICDFERSSGMIPSILKLNDLLVNMEKYEK